MPQLCLYALLCLVTEDFAGCFGKIFRYGCKVCAVYGGAGKWEMQKALKEGPEIVVATPGRLIEMIKLKSTNMQRCTMMVREKRSGQK